QTLEQAIGRVGLDRDAVAREIASGEFDTVVGKIKLVDNQLRTLWLAGQWQNGKFVAIAPAGRAGANQPVLPKPDWK
ncbi:MAG: twin-arginine translocation pathway signal protein, partial [Rhodospirillales bacterium]|nr:twin-arginine translocation pathway signal protein [Rhodospirillales bacterium]